MSWIKAFDLLVEVLELLKEFLNNHIQAGKADTNVPPTLQDPQGLK